VCHEIFPRPAERDFAIHPRFSVRKFASPLPNAMPASSSTFFRCLAALFAILTLKGCKPASPPPVAGVSIDLRYPVLLIGQRTFDVRDSEAALINVPGASSLNLFERVILDSDGRLFEVVSARPDQKAKPFFLDMGTGSRPFEVILREKRKPSFSKIQELAEEQINSANSIWWDDPAAAAKAVAEIRSLRNIEELIASCREYWNWTR
jgi:hypothetical protein